MTTNPYEAMIAAAVRHAQSLALLCTCNVPGDATPCPVHLVDLDDLVAFAREHEAGCTVADPRYSIEAIPPQPWRPLLRLAPSATRVVVRCVPCDAVIARYSSSVPLDVVVDEANRHELDAHGRDAL